MTIKRLRDAWDGGALRELYATPHDHTRWPDHVERVNETIRFAHEFLGPITSVTDLSAGSGAIARGLGATYVYLGDIAPGYDFVGPIEETITRVPYADAFICCETIEHLDDPRAVLAQIREVCDTLILSTPVNAWDDGNAEHYWAWDRHGVERLLNDAGFEVGTYTELFPLPYFYRFGLWGCR